MNSSCSLIFCKSFILDLIMYYMLCFFSVFFQLGILQKLMESNYNWRNMTYGPQNCKLCIKGFALKCSNPTLLIHSHWLEPSLGGSNFSTQAAPRGGGAFAAFCINKKFFPGGMPPDPHNTLMCSVFLALAAAAPLQCERLEPPVWATYLLGHFLVFS